MCLKTALLSAYQGKIARKAPIIGVIRATIPDNKIDRAKLPDIPRFQVLSGQKYLIIMVRHVID